MIRPVKYIAAMLAMAGSLQALTEVDSLDAAVERAAKENRIIMLEFTGTDWCTACIHLHTKILSSAEFEQAAGSKYIVTQVDYPRTPALVAKLSDEEKARREHLLATYGIRGLPAMVLMDSQGRPFAIINGTRPTTKEFLAVLEEADAILAKRDAAFAKAGGLTGMEKAAALAEGLNALPVTCRDKYEAVITEINSIDTQNTLGYKYVLGAGERLAEQSESFQKLCETYLTGSLSVEAAQTAIDKIDEFLAREDLDPVIRQLALRTKGDCYALFYHSPDCFEKTVECFKAALECAPESRYARRLKSDIQYYEEELIPRLKAEQEERKKAPESK